MEGPARRSRAVFRWLPVGAVLLFAVGFAVLGRELTLSDLLAWTPKSYPLAAAFVLAAYALKSLSLVFPLLILYLLVGTVFPLPLAFAVNAAGLAVCVSLPYLLGRWMHLDLEGALCRRWPKLTLLRTLQRDSAFSFVTLVRASGLLPGDVVSLYFGASGLRYGPYLAGSLAGMLPMMLAETALGDAVQDPSSWEFRLAAVCAVVLALGSLGLGYRMVRRAEGTAA